MSRDPHRKRRQRAAKKGDVLERARAESRPLTVAEFKRVSAPRAPLERDEQCEFVRLCRQAGIAVTAVPNQRESSDFKAVIRAKKMLEEGLEPGYPDIIFDEARGGYAGLRLEFKRGANYGTARGEPSSQQSAIHARLAQRGGLAVFVVWGAVPAWAVLSWYRELPLNRVVSGGIFEPPPIEKARWIVA